MIQLSGAGKRFGHKLLFENVNWLITPQDRIGLVGANGTGKSTVMKILAGLETVDYGAVTVAKGISAGYLPQDGLTLQGRTVFAECMSVFDDLRSMEHEMESLTRSMAELSHESAEYGQVADRYHRLEHEFQTRDGYALEAKVGTVLTGLGFGKNDWNRLTDEFSGGWQMRLALAKLLLQKPTLLLLDEPTNHLDLEARNWLEEYLDAYPHAVILVSHDRFFLDAVVTRIADLTLRTLTDYIGNYSDYIVQHEAKIEALRKAKREQDEEVARVKMFIDRFRYQATKASQVQSRIKMLEKVVPIEVPPERKKIHFNFPSCAKSGRTVLELKHVRKAYGNLIVFGDVNLHIERGDAVALVGPNGTGKSTLMRMLSGEDQPDAGERVEGHHLVMQYFAQDEATRMDPAPTVYETLASD